MSRYPGSMSSLHVEISKFLRGVGISRHQRLLVAVSGGADSVALLYGLVALGQGLHVAHIHHGMRAEADADLEFVRKLAANLGQGFSYAHVDARKRPGKSPEALARELRYAALDRIRLREGCAATTTAHTLDDQAETVLLRQARGTTLSGLSAIRAHCPERALLRPLLGVRRDALREYLTTNAYTWREDASNLDQRIPRNRLRAQVLPVLEQIHPDAVAKIASLAQLAQESREREQRTASEVLQRALSADETALELSVLTSLGEAERLLALREWLSLRGLAPRITRQHLERAARFVLEANRGSSLSLPGDRELTRTDNLVELREAGVSGARSPRDAEPEAYESRG